jgi:hypothetical protein|tara:strand:- start:1634 stop:2236 length:603 start_codon:yes stop_codon:yes gene_type:complete
MAKPLDKRVTAILKGLGLTKEESLWDCHGTWVMYHRYIEIAGVKKKISIDDLSEIETNSEKGIVVIKCKASLDKMKVITYGEASPKNTRNAYPYAMAEKRAIDRAILKLIGLHGFIYSEDELDVKQTSNTKVGSSDDEVLEKFQSEIKNSKTSKGLKGYGQMYKVHMAKAKQSSHAIYLHTKTLYENKLKELNGGNHTNV